MKLDLTAMTIVFLLTSAAGYSIDDPPKNTDSYHDKWSYIFSGKVGDESGIFIKRADSEAPKLIIEKANWPEVSPDGKRVIYQYRVGTTLDIWSANIDGTDKKPLTTHEDHDYLPSWSPDGKWIVFTSWRKEESDSERQSHLYLMRADGTEQRRLMDEALGTSAGATWSPDGRFIVFGMKTDKSETAIFIAAIDPKKRDALGEKKQLTKSDASNGTAVFSPDGKYIAYYASDDSGSRIEIMGADGSGRKVIVKDGQNWYPRWTKSSDALLFVRQVGATDQDLDLFAVRVSAPDMLIPVLEITGRQNEIRELP